ncbi:7-methylguanosine phosphate-specific 5'-nucleotidase isoform X1 [Oopsacas minuta]|uniref:5'-nucleotidase n=1 Tax=Oopsacas minuta TaxID=111878 RepID=A0AAV7KI39_9METZ|nr:7-methylguanosine phosphate-specific 5'-nucleotidase isoform X1 [Oopsacas minuta]
MAESGTSLRDKIIEALEYTNNPNVHIRDLDALEKKISILKSSPNLSEDLLVISDFDYTLSKYFLPSGERSPTAYRILLGSKLLSEEVNKRDEELSNHYYPLELSSSINEEEKHKVCSEWWSQGNQLIISTKVNRDLIAKIVETSGLTLREGIGELMHIINSCNVSCLVFSAGLDYIIKVALKENKLLTPNVKVISNEMVWDDEGTISQMQGPVLTSYNKNYNILSNYPDVAKEFDPKKFVILLGDSPGDSNMANGMPNLQETLRIGFLNIKVEEKLENFKTLFDIVFTNDMPLLLFIKLLKLILSS